MCEQCLAEAITVSATALPGFSLMQAGKGSADWPAGWYGLVKTNDPWIVFPALATDPLFGMSDEEIDALPGEPEGSKAYWLAVEAFRDRYEMPPSAGWELVQACIAAGYSDARHGQNVECWLVHHLAQAVAAADVSPPCGLVRAGG